MKQVYVGLKPESNAEHQVGAATCLQHHLWACPVACYAACVLDDEHLKVAEKAVQ